MESAASEPIPPVIPTISVIDVFPAELIVRVTAVEVIFPPSA